MYPVLFTHQKLAYFLLNIFFLMLLNQGGMYELHMALQSPVWGDFHQLKKQKIFFPPPDWLRDILTIK